MNDTTPGWRGQVGASPEFPRNDHADALSCRRCGIALQRNDELGIDRRVLVSVGTGSEPIQSNRSVLRLVCGLALNSELAVDATETVESLEAVLTADYGLYIYDSPKTNLSSDVLFYPSLTDSGRRRVEFSATLRQELIRNLFLDIDYYTSYDSRPPAGEAANLDYGIVTSLGYSYGK